MDSSENLIMAAGIFIVCLLIGVVFLVADEAKMLSNAGGTAIANVKESMDNIELKRFNNKEVSGETVIDTAIEYKGKYTVTVMTKANPAGFTLVERGVSINSIYYINEEALFYSEIIRNVNGAITEIRFTQE